MSNEKLEDIVFDQVPNEGFEASEPGDPSKEIKEKRLVQLIANAETSQTTENMEAMIDEAQRISQELKDLGIENDEISITAQYLQKGKEDDTLMIREVKFNMERIAKELHKLSEQV